MVRELTGVGRHGATLVALILAGVVSCSVPYVVQAAELIPSFDAHIQVHANATIEVEERIAYDFGDTKQHGIFRTIPYSYQAGSETYTADISSVIVSDEGGRPLPFNESRGNGELTIKIGDPDKTVTGEHTYVISYVVTGPFLYFDDYDEFYWNVTGSWPKNSIAVSNVLIDLPPGVQVLQAACYQGAVGSREACSSDKKLVSEERAGYSAQATGLAPMEGFTVSVGFPKGAIARVTQPWDPAQRTPWRYAPFALPLVVLGVMLRVWFVRGRDPRGMGTIVTQFEPPKGVSPAVAGTLYNEQSEPREISAEIVRLAVEGYLRIHRIEETVLLIISNTDYLLERLNPTKVPEDPIGALILEKLFQASFEATKDIDGVPVHGVLMSKLKHEFVAENSEIQALLYEEVVVRGYFPASPKKVRTTWLIVGGVCGAASFSIIGSILGAALLVSAFVIAVVGWFMPVKTREGVLAHEHLEGFRRYLTVAEKDRIAFHNAPEKTPELFDKYLPYAIMFGVEKKWAEQFEDIYTAKPEWYSGAGAHAFAASSLVSDLSSFTDTVSAASAPQSSGSGGGGSSGGGFGGGGGGSW